MPKLATSVQLFILARLACYERPAEIRAAVRERFDVDVPPPQILYYDATASGTRLSPELRSLFFELRGRLHQAVGAVPIARKAFRLQRLQDLLEQEDRGVDTRAARRRIRAILDQAERELRSSSNEPAALEAL